MATRIKITILTVNGKIYKVTEIIEEIGSMTSSPIIDLTTEEEVIDLTQERDDTNKEAAMKQSTNMGNVTP